MIALMLSALLTLQEQAPRATDAEFLRRITLDLTGKIPSAEQARAFLADKDPGKREKLIDRLLSSPDYARRLEEAVTVMYLERHRGGKIPDQQWNDYLRKAFETNEPWDKIVRSMIASDGRADDTRPAMKLLADGAGGEPNRMTRDISRLFLGRDLLCAQCHDHPNVKDYKQAEYMGLFAYLSKSKLQDDPKTKKPVLIESAASGKVEFASVFSPAKKHETGPKLAGREEVEAPKGRSRELLADELVRHPQFARTSVNRFWFIFMGKGIIHPLDLDHKGNPPSDPTLLDALTKGFVESGFDVRALVRKIVTGDAYGRGGRAAPTKPLSAEQMAWGLLTATGALEKVQKAPSGKFSPGGYLSGKSKEAPTGFNDVMRLFVNVFGNEAGEPEVGFQPSMTHSLFLMNDRLVLDWLQPFEGGLVSRLSKNSGDAVAEELYLSILTRLPDAAERKEVAAHLERNGKRREAALGELAWALIASTEFRMNH